MTIVLLAFVGLAATLILLREGPRLALTDPWARALRWLGLGLWLISFALPTLYAGGRGDLPGIVAAILSLYVAPLSWALAGARASGLDLSASIMLSAYFAFLAASNLLMPLAWRRPPPPIGLYVSASIGATGVSLLPLASVLRLFEVAEAQRAQLLIGYYAWLASYWAVAAAMWLHAGPRRPMSAPK